MLSVLKLCPELFRWSGSKNDWEQEHSRHYVFKGQTVIFVMGAFFAFKSLTLLWSLKWLMTIPLPSLIFDKLSGETGVLKIPFISSHQLLPCVHFIALVKLKNIQSKFKTRNFFYIICVCMCSIVCTCVTDPLKYKIKLCQGVWGFVDDEVSLHSPSTGRARQALLRCILMNGCYLRNNEKFPWNCCTCKVEYLHFWQQN